MRLIQRSIWRSDYRPETQSSDLYIETLSQRFRPPSELQIRPPSELWAETQPAGSFTLPTPTPPPTPPGFRIPTPWDSANQRVQISLYETHAEFRYLYMRLWFATQMDRYLSSDGGLFIDQISLYETHRSWDSDLWLSLWSELRWMPNRSISQLRWRSLRVSYRDIWVIEWAQKWVSFWLKTSLFLTRKVNLFDLFFIEFYSVNNGKMEPFCGFLRRQKNDSIRDPDISIWDS